MKELGYTIKPSKLGEFFKSVLKIKDDSYWFNIPSKLFENLRIDKYEIEFEFMIDSDNRIVLVGPQVNRESPTKNQIHKEVPKVV